MGLSQRLASRAVAATHVLVVEVPGWWLTRAALEQALVERGWRAALSPADADVLVVCGHAGAQLGAAVDRVWDQLPGPRAEGVLDEAGAAAAVLDAAAAALLDERQQRADALSRPQSPVVHQSPGGMDRDMDHGDMDHDGMGHGDMDHGEMAPAGITLASGGADRDGLEMDVLHVPLGPVLPDWPAGLVLHCSLQGDVITQARAEVLGPAVAPPPSEHAQTAAVRAARRCDSAGRLLAVAGWGDAAAAARRVRHALLTGEDPAPAAQQLDRLVSRVTRSRTLRWLLRGLGPVADTELAERGLPAAGAGDAHDRLLAGLAQARAELGGAPPQDAEPDAVLAALPDWVTGLDLAAARLVVASFDPDTAAVAREARRA